MKITKLPDSCDPNKLLEDRIMAKYSVCPICSETRDYRFVLLDRIKKMESVSDLIGGVRHIRTETWYGNSKKKAFCFPFERPRYWKKEHFKCYACGAEWESEPYCPDFKLKE